MKNWIVLALLLLPFSRLLAYGGPQNTDQMNFLIEFDEQKGTNCANTSRYFINTSQNAGLTTLEFNGTTPIWIQDAFGNGLYVNGGNCNYGLAASVNEMVVSSWTHCALVRPYSTMGQGGGTFGMIGGQWNSAGTTRHAIGVENGFAAMSASGDTPTDLIGTTSLSTRTVYTVCGVRDARPGFMTKTLYLNGQQEAKVNITAANQTSNNGFVIGTNNALNQNFNGIIYSFLISKRPLSRGEIENWHLQQMGRFGMVGGGQGGGN